MKDKKYYVYGHFRKDNGKCYYIGKGHGYRYKKHNGRSKLHKYITDKYGCNELILIGGLTEEIACQWEKDMIQSYIDDGYLLSNNCCEIDEYKTFLVNHTVGGEDGCFKSGKANPMYGISPQDRMDSKTYDEWKNKIYKRLNNQYGENNPNYHNDTLKLKLQNNPELKYLYYPRPGAQNGRAKSISVYDDKHNFIQTFSYIGECCEWLKEKCCLNATIKSLRSNMSMAAKNGKPFHNYYFSFD